MSLKILFITGKIKFIINNWDKKYNDYLILEKINKSKWINIIFFYAVFKICKEIIGKSNLYLSFNFDIIMNSWDNILKDLENIWNKILLDIYDILFSLKDYKENQN